jgi:hypothetical protein
LFLVWCTQHHPSISSLRRLSAVTCRSFLYSN